MVGASHLVDEVVPLDGALAVRSVATGRSHSRRSQCRRRGPVCPFAGLWDKPVGEETSCEGRQRTVVDTEHILAGAGGFSVGVSNLARDRQEYHNRRTTDPRAHWRGESYSSWVMQVTAREKSKR